MTNLAMDVELLFEKGQRLFVERIDISGNTATLDRVVRRQFFIQEGDPFNQRKIKAAENRIRALGLFSDVSVEVLPGSEDTQVVIDVEVVEQPTGSLTFGAGYSNETGLGGIIEYGERNFWEEALYHLQSNLAGTINYTNYLSMNQCSLEMTWVWIRVICQGY